MDDDFDDEILVPNIARAASVPVTNTKQSHTGKAFPPCSSRSSLNTSSQDDRPSPVIQPTLHQVSLFYQYTINSMGFRFIYTIHFEYGCITSIYFNSVNFQMFKFTDWIVKISVNHRYVSLLFSECLRRCSCCWWWWWWRRRRHASARHTTTEKG